MDATQNAKWAWFEADEAAKSLSDPGLVHLAKSIQFLANALEESRKEDISNAWFLLSRIDGISKS